MKNIFYLVALILFASCGKEYDFVCTTYGGNQNGLNTKPYEARMTEREARRYERKHSENDNGEPDIIGFNEIQTDCVKK